MIPFVGYESPRGHQWLGSKPPANSIAVMDCACKRHDSYGVDFVERTVAAAESDWASAQMASSHHHGCDPLHPGDRLPMACFAEGLSAIHNGSALLLRLARPQCLAQDQSNPGRAHAPSSRAQANALGRYH